MPSVEVSMGTRGTPPAALLSLRFPFKLRVRTRIDPGSNRTGKGRRTQPHPHRVDETDIYTRTSANTSTFERCVRATRRGIGVAKDRRRWKRS